MLVIGRSKPVLQEILHTPANPGFTGTSSPQVASLTGIFLTFCVLKHPMIEGIYDRRHLDFLIPSLLKHIAQFDQKINPPSEQIRSVFQGVV